jgi:hypothetical protein
MVGSEIPGFLSRSVVRVLLDPLLHVLLFLIFLLILGSCEWPTL